MALQLPKIDLSDAKTRVIIIVSGILGFVLIIYTGVHLLSTKTSAAGASHLASAPGNLQSVPGGQLTPEYYRALVQANAQAAKQAKISGGSAVPTLLNEPGSQPPFEQPSSPSCTVVCPSEDKVTVENDVNDLVKAGKLSEEEGKKLIDLANKNVAVSEYAAHLNQLVKEGKLSPEQARRLLDDYKKQHENALLQESGKTMDALIKSGQLPVDAANELLDLQKKQVSPAEYAAKLNELVQQGKISPQTAGQLLAQYTQQQAREASAEALGQLAEMAATGQIAPDVARELADYQARHVSPKEYEEELQHLVRQGKLTPAQAERLLAQYKQLVPADVAAELGDYQKRNVPVAEYQAELDRLVAAGKITPEQAQQLLATYRHLKGEKASTGVMDDIVQQAEKANVAAMNQLPPAVAQKVIALQQAKVPVEEYKRQLDALVRQGKLTPEQAQQLLQAYQQLHGAQDAAARLNALRANNASVDDYANELKGAVTAGLITPDQATHLLKEYQDEKAQSTTVTLTPTAPVPNVKGADAFTQLQKRVQAAAPTVAAPAPPAVSHEQFSAAASKAKAEADKAEQDRIQGIVSGMSGQAGQLISSWQPPSMSGQMGASGDDSTSKKTTAKAGSGTSASSTAASGGTSQGVPMIKAGTIIYAVLDTAINSDYPDSPVLATIVDGKYKGAKLLGKIAITQGQDRVALTFKLMDMEDWTSGKTINAYAIDPDTARTALASNVNYHYFVRYGSLFASSFLQGYASAISNSGATTSSGIFGTTTTHPSLSPGSKIMTGLGQVGQTLGTATQNYVNTPPTVKIDPGISLGILFMQDVPA